MSKEEVACVALDDFFEKRKIPKCDVMKIDVQGAELGALESASKMLAAKKIDFLIIENNFYGDDHNTVREFLENLGHRAHDIAEKMAYLPPGQPMIPKRDYLYCHDGVANLGVLPRYSWSVESELTQGA